MVYGNLNSNFSQLDGQDHARRLKKAILSEQIKTRLHNIDSKLDERKLKKQIKTTIRPGKFRISE